MKNKSLFLIILIIVTTTLPVYSQPQVLREGTVFIYYAKYRYGSVEATAFVNFTIISVNNEIVVKVESTAKWMQWLTGVYRVRKNGTIVEGKYKGENFILWIKEKKKYLNTLKRKYVYSGKDTMDSEQVFVYATKNSMLLYRKSDLILYSALIPLSEKEVTKYNIIIALYSIKQPEIPLNDLVKKAVGTMETYALPIALIIAVVSVLVKKILLKRS
ncbi:MAG: hypothetical protein DRJ52_03595 [Thermoprotei archaeon]|nr:MAG: hypothetical protein DRJ52_03595 [Thermoprotei archaeon]RLE98979.1 MAG: hypothetical protein DRJ63_06595 [Thermoprotei archaeon]